jgi:hypothetical protein
MIEIQPYQSPLDQQPTFSVPEYHFPTVNIEYLNSAMGRFSILKSLLEHQAAIEPIVNHQVWCGIDGSALVKSRSLFSEHNSFANPEKLQSGFYATQTDHWKTVVGEIKYSPFTYIVKAHLRGQNDYPTIVGFDRSKLIGAQNDDENMYWCPVEGETVESSLHSIYYFTGLFPKGDA